jgi:hypothetical protein
MMNDAGKLAETGGIFSPKTTFYFFEKKKHLIFTKFRPASLVGFLHVQCLPVF